MPTVTNWNVVNQMSIPTFANRARLQISFVTFRTSYVRDWVDSNGVLHVTYRSSSTLMIAERHKAFTNEILRYSVVKATPRVPLTFFKFRKTECENFGFVPLHHTQL